MEAAVEPTSGKREVSTPRKMTAMMTETQGERRQEKEESVRTYFQLQHLLLISLNIC